MIDDWKTGALFAASILIVAAVFLLFDPVPQWADYHDFADKRTILNVPNFWNVASNALFLVFGVAGLKMVASGGDAVILPDLRAAYLVLFAGITLTGIGSGWYHLSPDNGTLFWDRLPMTIAFMSLFTVVIGEHVSEQLGRRVLWPLLAAGAASVLYWDFTEANNAGDLRFYAIVQFLPMLLIPAILVIRKSAFDTTRFLWHAMILYALAKLFEYFDPAIFAFGELMSGHSLKHIASSLVPLALIHGFRNRQLRNDGG